MIRLPDENDCIVFLRRRRFGDQVSCVFCKSGPETVRKRGTTGKDAQQYQCTECDRYFSDLSGTLLANHRFELGEMFYMLRYHDELSAQQIATDLDRSYKSVLEFIHEIKAASEEELSLFDPIRGMNGAYWGPLPRRR